MTPGLPEILRLATVMTQLNCHATCESSEAARPPRLRLRLALHQMVQGLCLVSVHPDRLSRPRSFLSEFLPPRHS
jgi:hypothetical protein